MFSLYLGPFTIFDRYNPYNVYVFVIDFIIPLTVYTDIKY